MIARESHRLQQATPGRLPLVDALIAACAASRKEVLVHRDSHMRSIPLGQVGQLDLASPPAE
jgi:predicted nucleic acid-binding protein